MGIKDAAKIGYIGIIGGLLLFLFGLAFLLNSVGAMPFALPNFIYGLFASIGAYILAGAGLFLVVEDLIQKDSGFKFVVPIIIGLVVLSVGVVDVLNAFGVLEFSFSFLPAMVYYALFMLEGIGMMLASLD